ncbi:MAG: cytochrome c peroxidase [Kofleriaceae bacterium]
MWRVAMVLTAALWGAVGCSTAEGGEIPDLGPPAAPSPASHQLNPRLLRRFRPLDRPPAGQADQVALGKMLYFERRLSLNADLACNTCHPLDQAGAEHVSTSRGTDGQRGKRNAPTVYNASAHVAQFWDGRASTLEDQAAGPILASDEMAMIEPSAVAHRLRRIPGYVIAFGRAFPGEPIDLPHVGRALAAFERTLVTPARWDRFLDGEQAALSAVEQRGLKLFSDVGCVQCHTGALVGGSMFQKAGVVDHWPSQDDQGRFEVTRVEADRMVFKVPSLRNVTRTGPYFHDGSVGSLRTAIAMMGRYQLGVELSPAELTSIEAWLHTLDGAPLHIEPPTLP